MKYGGLHTSYVKSSGWSVRIAIRDILQACAARRQNGCRTYGIDVEIDDSAIEASS